MARVTYVKKAQQRYATVAVKGEDGNVKTVAVTRKDGSAKTTKKGRAIVRHLSVSDKSQPLPNHTCDKCGKEIEVGQPYKWVAPKSGPYGGSKRFRCEACPTWHSWELSSSLSARLDQVSWAAWEAFTGNDLGDADDITSILTDAAGEIREIAEEKEEGAQNIEDGFGHETSQSEELKDIAQQLNEWADEVENYDVPDFPEVEGDEPTEDEQTAIDEWHSEVEDVLAATVDSSPV